MFTWHKHSLAKGGSKDTRRDNRDLFLKINDSKSVWRDLI